MSPTTTNKTGQASKPNQIDEEIREEYVLVETPQEPKNDEKEEDDDDDGDGDEDSDIAAIPKQTVMTMLVEIGKKAVRDAGGGR